VDDERVDFVSGQFAEVPVGVQSENYVIAVGICAKCIQMKAIGGDENSSWALLQKCRDFLIAEIRHVIDLSLVGVSL
jgi:hypothetical protein